MHPVTRLAPLNFRFVIAVFPLVFAVLAICLMLSGAPLGPSCGGMPVDVPFAPHASFIPLADTNLEISVRKDGTILIATKWYPLQEFAEKMREYRWRASSKHIVIQADRSLSFGQLRPVLSAIRSAGFTNVSLITFRGSRLALLARAAA